MKLWHLLMFVDEEKQEVLVTSKHLWHITVTPSRQLL